MIHFKYKELLFCIHVCVLSYAQQPQATTLQEVQQIQVRQVKVQQALEKTKKLLVRMTEKQPIQAQAQLVLSIVQSLTQKMEPLMKNILVLVAQSEQIDPLIDPLLVDSIDSMYLDIIQTMPVMNTYLQALEAKINNLNNL